MCNFFIIENIQSIASQELAPVAFEEKCNIPACYSSNGYRNVQFCLAFSECTILMTCFVITEACSHYFGHK